MEQKNGYAQEKRRYILDTALILTLIVVSVGAFTYYLYQRIVDESKMLAWEMTQKSAKVMELRLDDIRSSLTSFSEAIFSQELSLKEAEELALYEKKNHSIFRMHIIEKEGKTLTENCELTGEDMKWLEELCPSDGEFSAAYIGKSGRWQTALAYSGTVGGIVCRIYAECVLDDLYLDDFMEFYKEKGYCYMISGDEGEFIMLPHNKFGQGLYSGLFAMLRAYEKNDPVVIDEIRNALLRGKNCTVQLDFKGQLNYFCFVPLKDRPDWFIVSMVPSAALQKNGMIAILAILLLGIMVLMGAAYLLIMNRRRWKLQYEIGAANLASQAKSDFLSNMSHEIRTPMNAIIGTAEIMKLNLSDSERIEACVEQLSQSSNYLLGIINDILDMSKIENNKMTLEMRPFSVSELTGKAVDLVLPQVQQRGHELNTSVYWNGPEVLLGDGMRISQILVNILANAVKYTPEGGRIRLRVCGRPDPDRENHMLLRFEVEDNGIGMTQEYQKIIFEPFSQEKNSFSRGTGLGMAIASQLVHLMEGELTVESECDKGSQFCVALSLAMAERDSDDRVPPIEGALLLVHPDPEMLKAAQETFTAMKVQVVTADSAVQALMELGRDRKISMILADCRLGEALREISKQRGTAELYLIGYGILPTEELRELQGKGFVHLPLFPSKLLMNVGEKADRQKRMELPIPLRGMRILLAEDNELNAEIAIELLNHLGAEIDRAADGEEAVRVFTRSTEGQYDLILMDIQMPCMNGYEASMKIRELKRSDAVSVPILAMTADAFADDVARAKKAGMDGHIAKPIDMETLMQKIIETVKREDRYESKP